MAGFQVAVTSAKGGSGTTTVAAALSLAVARRFAEVQVVDCDVESPDASLFLQPGIDKSTVITSETPEVLVDRCTGCGECQAACQYNAIRVVSGRAEVNVEACHGCGCCKLVCPVDAIIEHAKRIGTVESGSRQNIVLHKGSLDMGRPLGSHLIRGLKAIARADIPTIVDCSSGTTSEVISGIRGSDYCIIVAEPTAFGLHNLKIIARVVGEIGVPAGIVVNKDRAAGSGIDDFAAETGTTVLMRIPFKKEIASLGSRGVVLTENPGSWDEAFWDMYQQIVEARR
jgi:MinD superfamily P-loop ATPase